MDVARTPSEMQEPPGGFEWVWVPEAGFGAGEWEVLEPETAKTCRYTIGRQRCLNKSVARLNRSRIPKYQQWWHYCEDHMFGRRIRDGVVEHQVCRPIGVSDVSG